MALSDRDLDNFLNQTHVAVISTLDADNRPRSAPIWYQWEDGAAYLFTDRRTLKWRNIQRYPYVSLCVDWRQPPYKSAIIEGKAEEVNRNLYELVLSMSLRYYGKHKGESFAESYRDKLDDVVTFRIVPDRITSFKSED